MQFVGQDITVCKSGDLIHIVFGNYRLCMSPSQAVEVSKQLEKTAKPNPCCGTCALWSGSGGQVMGRCTAVTPEWATRENECVHKTDGVNCSLYQVK